MERLRLFLFATLGLVALLLWNAWQHDYPPQPASESATPAQVEAPHPPAPGAAPDTAAAPTPTGAPAAGAPVAALPQGDTIRVLTDLLELEISTAAGDIRQVRLREYSVSATDPTPFTLLSAQNPPVFIAQSGLLARQAPAPGPAAVLESAAREYTLADGQDELIVPLTWTSETGVKVTKRYVFHRNSYLVGLRHEVVNGSDAPWQGYQYVQLRRTPEASEGSLFFARTYTGGVLHSPEERYQKLSFEDMTQTPIQRDAAGGWLAMIQHYFLAAWVPPTEPTYRYYTRSAGGDAILGASSPWQTAAPGGEASFAAELFVGPKEQHRLAAVAPDLELTVDYGYLTVISKPLFWLLEKIEAVVGNWGWAIIILTLLIKIVFYKLSETSYRSMARMRKLQPKMKALKDRLGDDRQRMNQELMELYKREKINPLGGCLPIVVQIPVFISLYWMLLESVQLRQADWIFWINDLSTRDPYFVLPVLMGISMLVQQRLNPAPMDPIQQKVLMVMPIVFTGFFLFFPAGLVIYWVTNNILSVTQQWIITRRIERGEAK